MIEEPNLTVILALSILAPNISKQKLKQALTFGAVWLTQKGRTERVRRAKRTLNVGDEIHLYYNPDILFPPIIPAKLVSYEGEYSIWNKPCGMFSQGTKWADHSSIARWVELFGLTKNQLPQQPSFLVHRLDRATSGLIVIAHSKKTAAQFSQLFELRKIDKRYKAVVNGKFPANLVLKELTENIDGKAALSTVLSSEYYHEADQSSLIIQIKTGRKHQIRKHLSGIGFPVVGDRLYGRLDDLNIVKNEIVPDLMLQSNYLKFKCPISAKEKMYHLKK